MSSCNGNFYARGARKEQQVCRQDRRSDRLCSRSDRPWPADPRTTQGAPILTGSLPGGRSLTACTGGLTAYNRESDRPGAAASSFALRTIYAFNATRVVFFPQSKPHPLRLFTFSGGAAAFATAAPSLPHSEAASRRFDLPPRLPTLFVFPRLTYSPLSEVVTRCRRRGARRHLRRPPRRHVFEINGYSKHKGLGHDKFVRSCTFSVGGHDWCIRFYPDGAGILRPRAD
ncbi:hypothetical protein HU200_056258 [Digitaria exilis]|uniref:MATH domain-containing protein n=1 Tax=Digitaria exilis TaxID=1010633 RepID=A0A835E685_9POAL|nr:hypothetical protein HU200_056258 [Digitaria exilis]